MTVPFKAPFIFSSLPKSPISLVAIAMAIFLVHLIERIP
jgi:hypothetical protein